jgi:ligand-binding sensor domain-containing protein
LYILNKKIIILICLLSHFFTNAQNPVSRNITNQNGLPSNTVYNILQDRKGFIWLGHDKGLSRYDGNTFINFTAPAQQGKSVSNLLEIDNSIWCQDFSGNFYYTKNESLLKEAAFRNTGTYSPAGVLKGDILSVINYDTIRKFNIPLHKKTSFITTNQTMQAVFHQKNFSYFFNDQSLKSFNGETIETLQTFKNKLPIFSFLLKADNLFFAFTRNTFPLFYKINGQKIEPLPILKNGLLIQDVTIIENEIWISTTSGAYCFDKNMQPLYNGDCFFAENSITKIIKDRENNYWFGTLNKGLLIVPDINVKLYKYGNETITALSTYNNNNEVLAGTSSNLIFTFNSKTYTFNTLVSNETRGEIFSLYYDKPLQLIVSCANGISYYKNGFKIKEEALAGKAITLINTKTYVAAFAGGITLLGRQGTSILNPEWLNKYISNNKNKNFLTEGFRGRSVLFDSASQTLYTATAEGLKYYNATASNFILQNNQPIYASSLCMLNGSLYVGTFSDGIIKINNNTTLLNNTYETIANTIYKMYADDIYLWLSSDELIQRFNTNTGEVINYTSADGLPKAEIKDIVVQNGKTYLATTDGLVIFNSNKNAINTIKPLLQLSKLLVNNIEKFIDSSITLKPYQNNIELQFSLLTFKENIAATISYKVNNEDWKKIPKGIRSLQLVGLASGNYTIEIKAENEDGIAAEKNIILHFTISIPFYKKPWFYGLISFFVLGTMYLYFQQKIKREKKNTSLLQQKITLEKELHQSVLASIKSQMNPHFLFNALNTIQSYIYTNDKENASMYLGKFSELTRTILDMSNKERISLVEEIKALQLYMELEQLRFEDKLQCSFIIDENISLETTQIPSMLIQPYIENAIKHGLMHQKHKWELTVSFKNINNAIEVIIDDNGVGRKASNAINQQRNKNHQSFASGANQRRLEILNKGLPKNISVQIIDKKDEFGNALGTTIVLTIPF